MENENNRLLKLFYAGALVDAVNYYSKHGILEDVTREKREHQMQSAATQLKQLGVENLEQLYSKFSKIFGCAAWNYNETDKSKASEATTTSCLLCAIAKKQGTEKPCTVYCINPFTAFADTLGYELEVKSTLWESPECRFVHKSKEIS